jgi:hypothetical protein
MQLVPLPAMKPLQPSSRHIFASALGTDILYSLRPTPCTWNRILSLSNGDTTVRETAPATPPAINDARTGCARISLKRSRRGSVGGGRVADCPIRQLIMLRLNVSGRTLLASPGVAERAGMAGRSPELLEVLIVENNGARQGKERRRGTQQPTHSQSFCAYRIEGKGGGARASNEIIGRCCGCADVARPWV